MIIALVQIPRSDPKRSPDAVIPASLESTKIYRNVKGLRRKYYLNGDDGGGGVYEFASREDALAWFNEDWAGWIEERFGARPTLTLFDNHVVLDNEADEVRVNGEAVPAPWRDAA